jgi:cation diffusion facilitator family transporter
MFLMFVVGLMVYGSVERLFKPEPIQYQEAVAIAVLGLVVNLVSAFILGAAHHGGHGPRGQAQGHAHERPHDHGHGHHHDLNLRSAYVHVIADAATSVAAIVALIGGWLLGWSWLDPVMGIVGAVIVALWAKELIKETSKVLLDREMDHPVVQEIRDVIEAQGAASETAITDLHVWRVGKGAYACALSLVTHDAGLTPHAVRTWLSVHKEIVHSTIEIHVCPEFNEAQKTDAATATAASAC